MSYRVIVPCAGVGSRLGDLCDDINKTLVPIANRPIISYIVEKFDKNVEIVIALGHKGSLVKDFLELAYPERRFIFVVVDNFDGQGSSLGYSLLKCKDHLQCPFVFFTNDAIILDEIPSPNRNWVGYSDVAAGNDYRSIVFDSWNGFLASSISEKRENPDNPSYIGVCGIKDYAAFWSSMVADRDGGKTGEICGLKPLFAIGVDAIGLRWLDTGTPSAIEAANGELTGRDDPNILPKKSECIWFCNDKVIKFSTDSDFISKRVLRARLLDGYCPQIIGNRKNMYCYPKIPGEVLSSVMSVPIFRRLLSHLEGFWDRPNSPPDGFRSSCKRFYMDKTYERVELFFRRFPDYGDRLAINGETVDETRVILDQVDWDYLSDGDPVRFHGDLHFENLILSDDGTFHMIDWREDFGGQMEYGDIYYDLAKVLHGIIVSHLVIFNDLYTFSSSDTNINFEFMRRSILVDCEKFFNKYLDLHGYDRRKVRMITSLIFINIAPLHHDPYSRMLFSLGKTMLLKELV